MNLREKRWSMSLTTIAAVLVLVLPLFWMQPPWFVAWAIVVAVPYGLILTRSLRAPDDRTGPALAMGVCAVMTTLGMLLILVQLERRERLPLLFPSGLLLVHLFLGRLAVQSYRRGTSTKPHWRLLLRGFVDPIVYYGILFFVAAGANTHI